jgi:hypothetical protein
MRRGPGDMRGSRCRPGGCVDLRARLPHEINRFVLPWIAWSPLRELLLVLAYLISEGAHSCEGPPILSVNDSDPFQCDDPTAALPSVRARRLRPGLLPGDAPRGRASGPSRTATKRCSRTPSPKRLHAQTRHIQPSPSGSGPYGDVRAPTRSSDRRNAPTGRRHHPFGNRLPALADDPLGRSALSVN